MHKPCPAKPMARWIAILSCAATVLRAQDDDPADLGATPIPSAPETISSAHLDFFESKIRPLLVNKCVKCHSSTAEKPKGGLALDTREGARRGGESGPAVVPFQVDESLMIEAVRYQSKSFQMPPKSAGGKLPEDAIRDLERWIALGAPDPRDGTSPAPARRLEAWESSRDWWAWKRPVKSDPPRLQDSSWPRSDIDRFVLAALEAKGLRPVPDADRADLLRRVFFDLIGLPPTPEELEAFLADTTAEAWRTVVDKLLESPRFGERWGRHWLDVARFAESSGKEVNIAYPHAWRYRDYVIAAFNADKPYDEFIREQIAGDLLPAKDDKDRAENIVATGFLALGPKSLNERNPRQFRMDEADEQVDVMSQAILGMTISCARCHDHKFDPIPQREYYAVAGIFLSTETHFGTVRAQQNRHATTLLELAGASGLPVLDSRLRPRERERLEKELEELRTQRDELRTQIRDDRRRKRSGREPSRSGEAAPPGTDEPERRTDKKADRPAPARLRQVEARIAAIETRLAAHDEGGKPKLLCMGVEDQVKPFDSPVFARGEIDKPGEKAPRGFVGVLWGGKAPRVEGKGSGRLELAEWLVARDNPLAARVMANRVWHWLFGRGIVPTVDNFGSTGQKPDNQPLLDHLALRFQEQGWSVKKLIREIVLSRTYQLGSTHDEKLFAADPDEALRWRSSQRRLDAECIRDAMLAISGRLELVPPIGSAVARAGDGPVAGRRRGPRAADAAPDAESRSRTVYLPVPRDALPDFLAAFDFAEPTLVTGARETTNVPSQALFLLNSPFVEEQAEATAERILVSSRSQDDRIRRAYLLMYSRVPTDADRSAAADFFRGYPAKGGEKAAWTGFCRALFASAEFRQVD